MTIPGKIKTNAVFSTGFLSFKTKTYKE